VATRISFDVQTVSVPNASSRHGAAFALRLEPAVAIAASRTANAKRPADARVLRWFLMKLFMTSPLPLSTFDYRSRCSRTGRAPIRSSPAKMDASRWKKPDSSLLDAPEDLAFPLP